MNNLFRGLLAGYGAKKLGGGCFSTVLVFVLLWVLLGQCGDQPSAATRAAMMPVPAIERVESPPAVAPAVSLAAPVAEAVAG